MSRIGVASSCGKGTTSLNSSWQTTARTVVISTVSLIMRVRIHSASTTKVSPALFGGWGSVAFGGSSGGDSSEPLLCAVSGTVISDGAEQEVLARLVPARAAHDSLAGIVALQKTIKGLWVPASSAFQRCETQVIALATQLQMLSVGREEGDGG